VKPRAQALIVFSPSGKRGQFPVGTTVLQAARQLGVDIDSICGGRACCGRCQVLPLAGNFLKEGINSSLAHLSELAETERSCRARGQLEPAHRLSCQAQILGDIRIDVPASSQVHHQVVRKDFEARDVAVDPLTRLYFVEVPQPDLSRPEGDQQRLLRALASEWQLNNLRLDPDLLPTLQPTLRSSQWQVTVAVRDGKDIIGLWPGLHQRLYGLAVDVGSTTIAVYLCDLLSGNVIGSAGAMNPQIRFGEDLMSRVSWVMHNPRGTEQLTAVVRSAINELIARTTAAAGVEPLEVMEVTLVGNPVMHHLVLGIDPTPLGVAPFALATDHAVDIPAAALGLQVHPNARAYLLPCIAGHVGADTAAVMLAETPWERDEITLLIDVGTNAELVLGNRQRVLAASSPTGPAFEGAQISCGQRAAPGAIERVRIDPATLEPRIKVIGCALWSDQLGFAEAVRASGVTGICGSGIIEVIAGLYLAGVVRSDGAIDGALAARSRRVQRDGRTSSYLLYDNADGQRGVVITQADVRAIQLAKAALYAGARLLMQHMGVTKVDRIRLAGAFGSQIDVRYAMILGMIPDCDLAQVSSAGNAAGTGARLALLSQEARIEIEQRARSIEKIETAVEKNFQQYFVEAMAIPHSLHSFTELARVVTLPARSVAADDPAGGRRRRRSRK
jgi:uncharacterized 2Fe-2S/4Fe-4S cluster protein (DUF4445 family)